MNYVEADTTDYHYRWREQNTNRMLVVIVNSPVRFYQDGSYFIIEDAKHHKHKFVLMGMRALRK